jgi:hypothetical protein
MSRWIKADDGSYVNLDHAVRMKPAVCREEGKQAFVVTMPDGESARVSFSSKVWLTDMFDPILPAQSGQEALVVCTNNYSDDGELERPTEVWFDRYPILGWRIAPREDDGGWRTHRPLLPFSIEDDRKLMVLLADGRVLWGDTEFKDIEHMQRSMLERAQSEWDYAQEKTAAAKKMIPAAD